MEYNIDRSKWQDIDEVREVDGGKLVLKVGITSGNLYGGSWVAPQNPASIQTIEAQITAVETKLDTTEAIATLVCGLVVSFAIQKHTD